MRAAIVLLALMLMQQQSPPRDPRMTTDATAGRIIGVVTTDETPSRPLRRARVMLRGAALDMPRSVMTDDAGMFAFERVPAGRFTMGAEKPGYVAMNYGAARPGRPGVGVQIADRQSVQIGIRLPHGAVITGTVFDADGQPAQGVSVTVMARRYFSGDGDYRYLAVEAPGPVTDDLGVYRAFGLPAGEYYVAAQPPTARGNAPVTTASMVRMMSRGAPSERMAALTQVFHPDATDVARASRVTVRPGEERAGVDIQLHYVPLATISGVVPVTAGWTVPAVTLARLDDPTGFPLGRLSLLSLAAHPDADGRFALGSIPPGVYRVAARSVAAPAPPSGYGSDSASGAGATLIASADVQVDGDDVSGLALTFQPALTISGHVVFEGTRAAPPLADMSVNVLLMLTLVDSGYPLPRVQIQSGGTFRLEGVIPGRYRGFSTLPGISAPIGSWWLKSVSAAGRELLDAPIELRESVADVTMTLADEATTLTGMVTDDTRAPAPEAYVVVFSADRAMWFLNSRRVVAVHPDRSGRYTIRNLPPGDYRVTTADLDQGEWFDPAVLEDLWAGATPIRISGIEKQTVDLTFHVK
jgi:hypothetical protein